MGMQNYFFGFWYAKKFHGYAIRHRHNMRVDVESPYTHLMVVMKMMMYYTDLEIETGGNSLRTKIK